MKKKVILLIADGIGDRPCSSLNNLTPLEFAETPNLDYLTSLGSTGMMDVLSAGTPIGTDLGHMILFGYNIKDYPGRGPIEAFGAGIELYPGDVAFRCNFATADEKLNIIDRRAGRIRENTDILGESINGLNIQGIEIIFKPTTEHRGVLILRGDGLSANVSDSDPKKAGKDIRYNKVVSLDNSKESNYTADIINELLLVCNERLNNNPVNLKRKKENRLPANFILTRGAGMMPNIIKLTDKYKFTGSCIAAEGTVLGVARLVGLSPITNNLMTGNIDTNIDEKAKKVLEEIYKKDFVALNFKAPDLMGHDNKPNEKVKAIEIFDDLVGKIINNIDLENTIVAVAADHSTPCERMEHSGDSVPILIAGSGVRRDLNNKFDEINCAYGGIGRIKGQDFSRMLYDYLEIIPKQGN